MREREKAEKAEGRLGTNVCVYKWLCELCDGCARW